MIFPPEIINDSTESFFVRRTIRSNIIYITIIIAIIITLISLPFAHVQITTQARGIIRTPYENNEIYTVVYGEIRDVFIQENSNVTKGDTLLILNYEHIQQQINRTKENVDENAMFIEDILMLLNGKNDNLLTPKYITELSLYRSSINEQQTNINFLHKEYITVKSLYEKDITPKQEFLRVKNNYESALKQKENIKEQFYNKWESERTKYEIEIRELESTIKQLQEEKNKYFIKAPISGSIIQFSGIKKGNFIAPSQLIAYISDDSELLVECYISPADIGFINETQKVAYQVDAFNYNQWGLAYGNVTSISNDIIIINQQPVFRVRCSLDDTYLRLKNDYKGELKKGMTLTGRFYLTDRSLWQLLFDKVDNWINPKL